MRTRGFIGAVEDTSTLLVIGALVFAMGVVALPALVVTVLAGGAIGALLAERATARLLAVCASLTPVGTTEPATPRRDRAGADLGSNEWHC